MNPQHTIPVLDDNGVIVTDSHAICAYLVDKYGVGNEKLYPKDLAKRALVNSRLHYDSGHLFCRLRFLFEPVFYEKYHELCPSRIEYLQRTYESLDRFVADSPYVCGQDMTIADLCLIATLSSLLKVAPVDETKYSNLIQWIERMKKLPYYEETNGIGAEELQQAVIECIKKNNVAQWTNNLVQNEWIINAMIWFDQI